MGALTSKVDLCNLALSCLGNRDTINNIDEPTTEKEKVFALWYDVTRQALLREVIPSFATDRVAVARLSASPVFGYAYAYEYPAYALRILGVGNVEDKQNNYSVEAGKICTDEDYTDGMEVRFIRDETDVTRFPPDFKILFAHVLAERVAVDIKSDATLKNAIQQQIIPLKASVGAINAQENRPIRISMSRFRTARDSDGPILQSKK